MERGFEFLTNVERGFGSWFRVVSFLLVSFSFLVSFPISLCTCGQPMGKKGQVAPPTPGARRSQRLRSNIWRNKGPEEISSDEEEEEVGGEQKGGGQGDLRGRRLYPRPPSALSLPTGDAGRAVPPEVPRRGLPEQAGRRPGGRAARRPPRPPKEGGRGFG